VGVHRLNHAVLYVRDVEVSRRFYQEALEFTEVTSVPGRAAFLRAPDSQNDHDLGLFAVGTAAGPSGAGTSTVGLYHLAWEVGTLAELREIRERLVALKSLVGASDHGTTKALYAHDPDGLEFEVCWLVPAALLSEDAVDQRAGTRRLDLDAEIARYGADTRGGLGVSIPLNVTA
jgi:catechol-2,3-dioxygenase